MKIKPKVNALYVSLAMFTSQAKVKVRYCRNGPTVLDTGHCVGVTMANPNQVTRTGENPVGQWRKWWGLFFLPA